MTLKPVWLWQVVFLMAALAVGAGAGQALRPPPRAQIIPCLDEMLAALEDAEKYSAGAADIVGNLVDGRTSTDATSMSISLTTLRDTMQEITEALGGVRTRLQTLSTRGRVPGCARASEILRPGPNIAELQTSFEEGVGKKVL